MFNDTEFMTNVYQFVVLIAIIGLNVLAFLKTGLLNEILLGALIGVMVGIPATKK